MYKGDTIDLTGGFSSETMEGRKQWYGIFRLEKKNCQARILYTVKLSFKNEGE